MSSEEQIPIKQISRHEYTPLIIILSLIGLLVVVVFIFIYHKRKYYIKKRAQEMFHENRKKKYIIDGSTIKNDKLNNSSIDLKFLNKNKIIFYENGSYMKEKQNSLKSEIKDSSILGNKQDDLILTISVPNKFKNLDSKSSPSDEESKGSENTKYKSNLESTDTNSIKNNSCKNLIKINNEPINVNQIKICKFVNSSKFVNFSLFKKDSIKSDKAKSKEKEIIFSENSFIKNSPRIEHCHEKIPNTSNSGNKCSNDVEVYYFSENPNLEKNEDFEKIHTIRIKE